MARKVLSEAMSTNTYDLSKMTSYELKEVLAPIRDAVAKRVVAIKKSGLPSPSLRALQTSGGNLSAKGKDKSALINEINRGKSFINMKTSTIKGSRSFLSEITKKKSDAEKSGIIKNLDEIAPDYTELKDRAKGRFWETLHKLKQDGFQLQAEEYDTANNLIRIAFKGKSPDKAFLNAVVPEEAWQYVNMESSDLDDKQKALKELAENIIDKTAMPNDERRKKGKIKGDKLDSYWAEKIAKMVEVYSKWLKDNPEFR